MTQLATRLVSKVAPGYHGTLIQRENTAPSGQARRWRGGCDGVLERNLLPTGASPVESGWAGMSEIHAGNDLKRGETARLVEHAGMGSAYTRHQRCPLIPFLPFQIPRRLPSNSGPGSTVFFAGLFNRGESTAAPQPDQVKEPLLILYGSQSGTAEGLAKQFHKQAAATGFASRVSELDAFEVASLSTEKNVLLITSTWGEGEMPDNAAAFWDALNQNGSSPALDGLNYAVLALGDSNYADTFCLAGKRLDQRFEELGARRVHPRIDCDVDYDEAAEQWKQGVFSTLLKKSASTPESTSVPTSVPAITEPEVATYSKKNPFPSPLLINQQLTGDGSAKDTRHFAFSLADSDLSYQAGDALGVFSQNCPDVVDSILAAKKLDPNAEVHSPSGALIPLREALIKHYEIRSLLGNSGPTIQSAVEFVDGLRKLQPRLYSIASSPKAHPGQVHLCVDIVRYQENGILHKGVASTFLADRLPVGANTGVFFQSAKHFRPPTHPDTPMIMVGPGTGIAPFRAFLEERECIGAPGRNWLFFGAQHRATDFLYRDQLTGWVGKRPLGPARPRILPRPRGENLRPTPHGEERGRPLVMARGRRPYLRLRRCLTYGKRRRPHPAHHHRVRGRHFPLRRRQRM